MPDDEWKRRRLGDETKGRIADLASGWTVDGAIDPPTAPDPKPRKKQKTLPPPPPGSDARKALEEAIVETSDTPVPIASPRTKPPSAPPPNRSKAPTGAPPVVSPDASSAESDPAETSSVDASGVIGADYTPAPLFAIDPTSAVVVAPASIPGSKPLSPPRVVPPPLKPGAKVRPSKSGDPAEASPDQVATVPSRLTPSRPVPQRLTPSRPSRPTPSMSGALPALPSSGRASGAVPTLPSTARTSGSAASLAGHDVTEASGTPSTMPPPIPSTRPSARAPRAGLVIDDADASDPKNAHLAVPIGEFDQTPTQAEPAMRRIAREQATIKRDAASALLSIPEASYDRGDPTLGPDVLGEALPATSRAARLRSVAALRRKRGLFGDLRYVLTAVMGVRHARREVAAHETKQATRQSSRKRHLITLGRTAASDGFDHPALYHAREQLAAVEDERAQHTAQVATADSELMRVREDRVTAEKKHAEELAAIEVELVENAKKQEPLEKEVATVTRRAAELREAVRRIDGKIAAVEASKVSVKGQRLDPAAIKAELASLKADRQAIKRDEPAIASELDALNPRIASLEARRIELRKRRIELDEEEKQDQRRAQELLAAIGAKRVVVDRAASDAEVLRDKILFELGERIYVDRPHNMFAQLSPIDAIDMELGESDRRMMELKEIISTVDKAKLARGIALLVLLLGAFGAIGWLIYMAR